MFDSMIPTSTTPTALTSPVIPNTLNSLGFNNGTFTVPQVPLPIEQQVNTCSSSSATTSTFVEKKAKTGKKSKVASAQQHQIYATPITDPNGNVHVNSFTYNFVLDVTLAVLIFCDFTTLQWNFNKFII